VCLVRLTPTLEELAKEFDGGGDFKINVDKNQS
jgi:hypothetical protein